MVYKTCNIRPQEFELCYHLIVSDHQRTKSTGLAIPFPVLLINRAENVRHCAADKVVRYLFFYKSDVRLDSFSNKKLNFLFKKKKTVQ